MLTIVKGDITKIPADAIVNAANKELIPGGGVDGAINRAAGPELGAVMRGIGGTPPGTAVHTKAFDLPAEYVIHAVGPIYKDYKPDEARLVLNNAYSSAIILAHHLGCLSVTIPLISTGVYGYPLDEACRIAVQKCGLNSSIYGINLMLVAFSDELCNLCNKWK